MTKKTRKSQKSSSKLQELVPVTTTDTMEQAKEFEMLLKSNDIAATISSQPSDSPDGKCFAVLVPEDMADEANVIIESQAAYDDFYDYAAEDDPDEDISGEIFDDDF